MFQSFTKSKISGRISWNRREEVQRGWKGQRKNQRYLVDGLTSNQFWQTGVALLGLHKGRECEKEEFVTPWWVNSSIREVQDTMMNEFKNQGSFKYQGRGIQEPRGSHSSLPENFCFVFLCFFLCFSLLFFFVFSLCLSIVLFFIIYSSFPSQHDMTMELRNLFLLQVTIKRKANIVTNLVVWRHPLILSTIWSEASSNTSCAMHITTFTKSGLQPRISGTT